jgi:hypothetical protein
VNAGEGFGSGNFVELAIVEKTEVLGFFDCDGSGNENERECL